MQAYAMRITIMERQRKKFEYENEVTTQIVGIRKAATGAKYVGSPPCLQAITCSERGAPGVRPLHYKKYGSKKPFFL